MCFFPLSWSASKATLLTGYLEGGEKKKERNQISVMIWQLREEFLSFLLFVIMLIILLTRHGSLSNCDDLII